MSAKIKNLINRQLPTANCQLLFANCVLLTALCQLLSSCYTPRYVYSPSAHNVPVLVKKGDNKVAVNYSFGFASLVKKTNVATQAKASGIDIQTAYAFSNKWAGQFNYMYRGERNAGDFDSNSIDSTVIKYKRNLTELGLGYFTRIGKDSIVLFQLFGGVGIGKANFTDNGRDRNMIFRSRYHNMNITKVFIQPALMVRSGKNFAASLSSRHSIIFFRKISTNYNATELNNYKLDSLTYRPRVFWEPAIINTFGFKEMPGVQFEFQMGFAFLMSRQFVDYRSSNISAGLLFDLPKLFTKPLRSAKN
jgi:hypothetical protein